MKRIAILVLAGLLLPALAAAQTAHSNTVTWPASPSPGVTYNVYRAPGSCSAAFVKINTTAVSALTYTDTAGLVDGSINCYHVTAVSSTGVESTASGTILCTTPVFTPSAVPAPPGQPASTST
jgi:hypothetical protein